MRIVLRIINKIKVVIYFLIIKIIYNKKIQIGKKNSFRGKLILNCDDNGLISIGDNVFFNRDCSINSHKHIEIGDDCIFGENVKIYDHNHVFNRINQLIRNQGYTNENVIIGKNCWIGSNVIILSGTRIGDNCVIGAGSVIKGKFDSNLLIYSERKNVISKINLKEEVNK